MAPAAAVASIQERYRGPEAAVAASGGVGRPVAEVQDVAEAGSVTVAAIGDVASVVAGARIGVEVANAPRAGLEIY